MENKTKYFIETDNKISSIKSNVQGRKHVKHKSEDIQLYQHQQFL